MTQRQRNIAVGTFQAVLFITMVTLALYQFKLRTVPQPVHFDNAEKALKEGREADARKEFDNAIKFRPDDPLVFASILQACQKQNKSQLQAEYAERFVAACKIKPAEVQAAAYTALSAAYSLIDKPPHQQRSIQAAKEAFDLQPGSHMLQNQYGYILADNASSRGPDVETSLRILKKTLGEVKSGSSAAEDAQLGSDFVAAVEDSYGWALYKNEQYADAITELTQALEDYSAGESGDSIKVSHYHLGMAFSKIGSNVQARNEFNSALAYDAKYEEALAGLSTLNALNGSSSSVSVPVPSKAAAPAVSKTNPVSSSATSNGPADTKK